MTRTQTDAGVLHVGLVNNMPDLALEATERQFRTLLAEAAAQSGFDGAAVRLSLFALPEVPRSEGTRRSMEQSYASTNALWGSQLDGLIVTGAEPVTANLADEPFWPSLTRLIAWAEHNTVSSIWSCLAAHATVLQIDGIRRQPFGQKLCGVLPCARTSDHTMTAGLPNSFAMPHSRWNDLPARMLSDCGYRILTRLNGGGVDSFIKQRESLFIFFQGHPEYEAASLLGEYRRDIRRFLARERDAYPATPEGYFDDATAAALAVLRESALADRREQSFGNFSPALRAASLKSTWRREAVLWYRNWLRYLAERKRSASFHLGSALTADASRAAPRAEAG